MDIGLWLLTMTLTMAIDYNFDNDFGLTIDNPFRLMQEINETVGNRFLHHNALVIRIHDVDILFGFYDLVDFIIINVRGTVFRNRLEMVIIKAEFAYLIGN